MGIRIKILLIIVAIFALLLVLAGVVLNHAVYANLSQQEREDIVERAERLEELISQQYNYDRAKLIDLNKAAKSVDAGNPALQHGDTVYLTTADKDGNMVSLIQSNYRGMGSGMTPPDLGFVLQDRGQMFDLTEGRFNTYAPGKRPFHTIIPAFVTKDGKPWLSFGVMGGATQTKVQAAKAPWSGSCVRSTTVTWNPTCACPRPCATLKVPCVKACARAFRGARWNVPCASMKTATASR